jgi:hypothetical protein
MIKKTTNPEIILQVCKGLDIPSLLHFKIVKTNLLR